MKRSGFCRIFSVIAMFIAILMMACSSQTIKPDSKIAADPTPKEVLLSKDTDNLVEAGDLVTVHYTMKLENGEVFYTTKQATAEDESVRKVFWFQPAPTFGPEEIMAGNEPTRRELALEVVGMHKGDFKSVTMPPEKGFGPIDEKKIVRLERVKSIPKYAGVNASDFMARMKSLPVEGREINWTPYFKSKITHVNEQYVEMEALIEKTSTHPAEYGTTTVSLRGDDVIISLKPIVGATFEVNGKRGRITQVDDAAFSVDFNHPAAGQSIILEMAVLDIEKDSAGNGRAIDWITEHDQGYEAAKAQHKPMVLVLYADWCGWCKKLLNTTVQDVRVQKFWNQFIWTKVNSDKKREYKDRYKQNGFPMVIMINTQGEVINRIEGFRDARAFVQELEKALAATEKMNG